MLLYRIGCWRWTLAILMLALGVGLAGYCAMPASTADNIVQKAVERAGKTQAARPAYTYTKVNVTEELDAKGKLRERKQRVFQVSFRGGSTEVKLIEVDGHRPADADLKFQAQTQSTARHLLGGSGADADDHQNLLTPEVVARFSFTLVGQTELNGRASYEIAFQPKSPALPVRHILDRVLNRVSGTLWIDVEEYEVARADLKLDSEVDLLGGLIGCLHKMAYTITRTRVADGVWLLSFSAADFEGRKLLDSTRIKTQSESMNFHIAAAR